MDKKNIVLVVAPSKLTKGGITSVVKAYEQSFVWNKWNCKWIESTIDKSTIYKILYFLIGIVKYLFNLRKASIIHIHLSESTSAIRKSFFFYIAFFFKKKIILHFHAFSPNSTIQGKYKTLYRDLFTKSNTVIVLSQYWKDEIVNCFGENSVHIEILFNPCNKIYEQRINDENKIKYILYAGALNSRKGYADLIKAFSIVLKKHSDWKLVLAGNGEIENGLSIAKNLNISDKTTFTGWITGEEKDTLFRDANIFCLPSYNEGFPMAVLDAISYGLPVITTPVGGILDVFTDSVDVSIFEPGDVETLAKKIIELIEDTEIRNKYIKASINHANTTFNIAAIVKKLDLIYLELQNKE